MNKNNSMGNYLNANIPIKHFFVIMRTTFIILFTCVFCSFAELGYTQDAKVTINKKNSTLKEVLDEIESQTGYLFIYNDEVETDSKVSIKVKQETVSDVLDQILNNKKLDYTMEGNHIMLVKNKAVSLEKSNGVAIVEQQRKQISGVVLDSSGEPIIGANIIEVGTSHGTITDIDGKFTLDVADESSIRISYIGFVEQVISVSGNNTFEIKLKEDSQALEEVVVVGYGTMKKSDLTGAVSQVGGDDLKNLPVRSVADALQGKTAGVMITSTGGSPGTPPAVRVRGVGTVNNNNPLYVVDGLPQTDIGWLNANNIASMEILKDASATAIYGSRAANGVIIITTNRGNEDGRTSITFDTYYGVQNPVSVYDMMNASQFIDYKNLANTNAGNQPFFSESQKKEILNFLKSNFGSEDGTNWWKEINEKNAPVKNYDLSISGGTKTLSYHTNFSYMDQKGIIKGSDFDRISWLTNTDHQLNKYIKLSTNFGLIKQSRRNVLEESPGFNTSFIAFVTDPITPVYRTNLKDIPSFLEPSFNLGEIDPNDEYSWFAPVIYSNKENPVSQTRIREDNIWKDISIKGGVDLKIDILPSLVYNSRLNIDLYRGGSDGFNPKYYLDGEQFATDATVSKYFSNTDYWVWDNTLTFNKKFNDIHQLTAMVGMSAEETKHEETSASRQGLVNNSESQRILNAASKNPAVGGFKSESALQSFFTRIFYSYDNKYLFTANIRRDGSSNFGPGYKWGTFPSFSLGWNFSEEDFLANFNDLSQGKLRLSWGNIGNQAIGNGAYLSTYTGNWGYHLFGTNLTPQLFGGNNSMGNPAVQWEKTEQLDVGLDLGFFNNSLTFNVDYFVKKTKDMLLQVPLPSYLGFPNNPWVNAGSIENKGWEFETKYRNSINDFNYSIGANLFTFKNKVTSLGGGEPIYGGGWIAVSTTKTEVGKPIGYFYGLKTDGIFQNQAEIDAYKNKDGELMQQSARPGDLRFVDVNGDGIVNADDRTDIGNPFPKFSYGLNFAFDYKGFDFQALFQGTYGNKIMNAKKIDMNSGVGWYNAPADLMEKAWSPTNPTNEQFQINTDNTNNLQVSDWLVEDGSYFRLKNLQIGYSLPRNIFPENTVSNLRLWLGGYNLLTFTKYTGLDPEIGRTLPLSNGVDDGYYPQSKTYMVGLNITF
ncbi:MAG: SusC/RagA family TonB-linked outer membrane protein [Fermentimonas sp.]|jgi:TonB-linked SusC/RagA family outer membrane protein